MMMVDWTYFFSRQAWVFLFSTDTSDGCYHSILDVLYQTGIYNHNMMDSFVQAKGGSYRIEKLVILNFLNFL